MDDFVPAPRETLAEVLANAHLMRDPFEAAVGVARHLTTHAPVGMPSRPPTRFSDRELEQMAKRSDRLEGEARVAVQQWQQWRVARANARATNAQRLRGLLWALDTLATKPDDKRTPGMAGLTLAYLREEWGYQAEVPAGYQARDEAVRQAVASW